MSILGKTKFNSAKSRTRFIMENFDLTLSEEWGYKMRVGENVYKLKAEKVTLGSKQEFTKRSIGKGATLKPGELYLIETLEWVKLNSIAATTVALQDAARKGMHVETGAVDVGFEGKLLVPVTVTKETKIHTGVPFVKFAVYDLPLADRRSRYDGNFQEPETHDYGIGGGSDEPDNQ